ncbi:hypothetical protein MLD38_002641 [Melastoma candidum]|uniref:Uncharacterized protein n=1 Tax=Melastoma candidum TaxID=119954 RepID=A0ACB9S1Y1_9MYRT|nr:hypothetical protein MLD38_002641 [Melastoma candidum]
MLRSYLLGVPKIDSFLLSFPPCCREDFPELRIFGWLVDPAGCRSPPTLTVSGGFGDWALLLLTPNFSRETVDRVLAVCRHSQRCVCAFVRYFFNSECCAYGIV